MRRAGLLPRGVVPGFLRALAAGLGGAFLSALSGGALVLDAAIFALLLAATRGSVGERCGALVGSCLLAAINPPLGPAMLLACGWPVLLDSNEPVLPAGGTPRLRDRLRRMAVLAAVACATWLGLTALGGRLDSSSVAVLAVTALTACGVVLIHGIAMRLLHDPQRHARSAWRPAEA